MTGTFAVRVAKDKGIAPLQLDSPRIEPTFLRQSNAAPAHAPSFSVRILAARELLFSIGEPRTHVYRVESGAVCLYESRQPDRQVEFVFPGEYVGLGFLDIHSLTARALLGSTVTCVPVGSLDDVIRDDLRAQSKLATAIEREFEARREELSKGGQRRPVERVAALLVASAHARADEGQTADRIEESWQCGYIADLLGIELDDLGAILVELKRQGLIEAAGDGIRLKDMSALDALADGARPKCYRRTAGTKGRAASPPTMAASCQAA